jgi:uncharacterized damage-inducible protein DinB
MNAEQAKFLAEFYATVLEQESETTVKVLTAAAVARPDYKPDPKSRSARELATHVATGDIWFLDSICDGAFNFDPDAEKRMSADLKDGNAIVEFYKREYPKRVARLRAMSGEQLAQTVDFFGMMKQPAAAFLSIANNHGIHHRGQLAAYLRAAGSQVPSLYGGSADEPMNG